MYKNYQKIIDERGISSYKVHKETGVPQSSLSDWKKGRSVPKIDKMQKIADYLNVSVDYLYGNTEDPMETVEQKASVAFSYTDALNLIIDHMAEKEGINLLGNEKKQLRDDIEEMGEIVFLRFIRNKDD